MKKRILVLKQHGFEVLNEERSSIVTRRDGVTYRMAAFCLDYAHGGLVYAGTGENISV